MEKEAQEQETQLRHGTVNFEKRKHPRFSVDLPVEYYKIGSPLKHNGRTMNASQSGLLLYFSEPVRIGQYLSLKLILSSGLGFTAIETIVEVVWTDIYLGEGWGDYRIGVKFIDISPEDMNKLKNFLLRLSQ